MEGEAERRADGLTDMEMQTVTFATLQRLFKMLSFCFFINYAECEIRIFLVEKQMAHEHDTHFHKCVHTFTIM
jgi:hypothetical protein